MTTTSTLSIGQHVYRVFPGGGLSASAYWVDRIVGSGLNAEVRLVRPGLSVWVPVSEVVV